MLINCLIHQRRRDAGLRYVGSELFISLLLEVVAEFVELLPPIASLFNIV